MEIYHLTEDDDFGKVGDWVFVPVGIFRERDTRGNWIALKRKSYYTFKKGYVPTKKHLAKICRSLLLQMLEHELDEGLWIDGERVFDPHRNGEP